MTTWSDQRGLPLPLRPLGHHNSLDMIHIHYCSPKQIFKFWWKIYEFIEKKVGLFFLSFFFVFFLSFFFLQFISLARMLGIKHAKHRIQLDDIIAQQSAAWPSGLKRSSSFGFFDFFVIVWLFDHPSQRAIIFL